MNAGNSRMMSPFIYTLKWYDSEMIGVMLVIDGGDIDGLKYFSTEMRSTLTKLTCVLLVGGVLWDIIYTTSWRSTQHQG